MKKELKRWLKSLIGKVGKWDYLIKFTGGIGKVVEEEERFICYVDQKKLDLDNLVGDELSLYAYTNSVERMKNIFELCGVNKPIYYIFDGIKFDKLVLYAYGESHVIFRNCEFHDNIIIKCASSVTFEDNKYYDYSPLSYNDNRTFLKGNVKKLKFINDNFVNSDTKFNPSYFGINVDVDTFEAINSNINIKNIEIVDGVERVKNRGRFNVTANNVVIHRSTIDSSLIKLNFNNIECANSKIISDREVLIADGSKKMDVSVIKSPSLVYNGKEITKEENKNRESVILKRIELIKSLRRLQNICEEIGSDKEVPVVLESKKIDVSAVKSPSFDNGKEGTKSRELSSLNKIDLMRSLRIFQNICEQIGSDKGITRTLKR